MHKDKREKTDKGAPITSLPLGRDLTTNFPKKWQAQGKKREREKPNYGLLLGY